MGGVWKKIIILTIILLQVSFLYIYMNLTNEDQSQLTKLVSLNDYKKSGTKYITSVHNLVVVVGSNYKAAEIKTPYVLVVPHFTKPVVNPVTSLHVHDQYKVAHFVHLLDSQTELDGVFGENKTKSSSCQFQRRNTTILIKNSGKTNYTSVHYNMTCNIAETAFLIRTEIFHRLWRPTCGILASLDFFIRSEGKLNMAKLGFTFSEGVNRRDRGLFEGTADFREYQIFGIEHKVFRIIYEDRIEWTKCADQRELCKEGPITRPQTLPDIAMPICCSHTLDRFLNDITQAMDNLGIDNRIIYGTLLGAVRSKSVIPWTSDMDIGVTKKNYRNKTIYKELQKYLGRKYWIGYSHGMYRMHACFPTYLKADFSYILRKNPDVLFCEDIQKALDILLPVVDCWRGRRYVDFYGAPGGQWMNGFQNITINDRQYKTLNKIEYIPHLQKYYGKNFQTPDYKWSHV